MILVSQWRERFNSIKGTMKDLLYVLEIWRFSLFSQELKAVNDIAAQGS